MRHGTAKPPQHLHGNSRLVRHRLRGVDPPTMLPVDRHRLVDVPDGPVLCVQGVLRPIADGHDEGPGRKVVKHPFAIHRGTRRNEVSLQKIAKSVRRSALYVGAPVSSSRACRCTMEIPISTARCTSSTISATEIGTWGVISFVGIIPVGVKLRIRSIRVSLPSSAAWPPWHGPARRPLARRPGRRASPPRRRRSGSGCQSKFHR